MESSATRNILYFFTLAFLFSILFGLDSMGVHYQPEEHRLNKKKNDDYEQVKHSESDEKISSHETAELANVEENEDDSSDPYFSTGMKQVYVAIVFFISIFFAIRTFRNKPSA